MAKSLENPNKTITNTIYSVLINNKISPKSKQQIDKEHYQKNKEKKKQQRKERYQKEKEQAELNTKYQLGKYYGAEAIKILISFKEYTELSKEKMKLWANFQWTLKDCHKGIGNVVEIMKLRESADNLIRDYWVTAKKEVSKGKSWNSLDYDQQQKLIRYWGYEKARIENGYLDEAERLERQSQEYLKEIESAKFHEQRGKINCECYACEEQKKIHREVIQEREKIIDEYEREQKVSNGYIGKEECPECSELVKELDEENGVCKNCMENLEF